MNMIKKILTVGVISTSLVGCGNDVVASDDIKNMSAVELATLYCTAIKETNIDQLKVLVTDKYVWEDMKNSRYSDEKSIAKSKLKAEKFDCTITDTKKRKKYTKFYFKNFKTTYVYHENGLNILKI